MKPVKYLVLILASYCTTLQAQVHQGDWLLGGGINAGWKKTPELRSWSVNIQPAGGYFFSDRFALSGFARISAKSSKKGAVEESEGKTEIGLMPIFYFWQKHSKIQPFIYLGLSHFISSSVAQDVDYFFNHADFGLGIQAFIRKDVALEFRQSIYSDIELDDTVHRSTVGLRVLLPKNRK
jgi:hypothetical protein